MNAEEGRKILKPIFLFSLPSIHLANGFVLYDCHIFPSVFLFIIFFLCEMNNLDLVEERHVE